MKPLFLLIVLMLSFAILSVYHFSQYIGVEPLPENSLSVIFGKAFLESLVVSAVALCLPFKRIARYAS